MKRFTALFIMMLSLAMIPAARENMAYFLPSGVTYNKQIPTPEAFFNQQLGDWHLSHHQVLSYLKEIARISDRVIVEEYARSHENRPLVHLVFTSEENHKKLDELKNLHTRFSEPGQNIPAENVPLVVSLNYGVHGNESSTTNSSVLTAYHLAAAEDKKTLKLLENTIVLVDPTLNPDGFTRHATWANMHQSATDMPDPGSRQFHEVWPGGRTNHYWFDLNRDYLLLVHPESQGRVARFHEWKPNIFTDHHEMGSHSTFFFQPGVPSRNNPLTPEKNYQLTRQIAQYHAHFLDEAGSSYFTEEVFDDYYFGKGSTYPDVNAGIGILFEQAGYRGRVRTTPHGIKTLAFGIKNQFTVTLSTLEAAIHLKEDLLQFQKQFYKEGLQMAEKDEVKAYIFGSNTDLQLNQKFIDLLNQHQIEIYENEKQMTVNGQNFRPGSSFVVPVHQKQYRLIKSVFEEVTTFTDSTFYDVSTWTLPYAFHVPFARLKSVKNLPVSEKPVKSRQAEGKIIGGKSSLAYLFRWDEYASPEALYQIQKAGIRTRVATREFAFEIGGKEEKFTYGTILVPVPGQKWDKEELHQKVSSVAQKTGIRFYGLSTGLSPQGIDAGSNSFVPLEKPNAVMLVGNGVSSRDAGEIWHLFDQRYHIPVCLTESSDIGSIDLDNYNVLILPSGSYSELSNSEIDKIKEWTRKGGTLIAVKSAAAWASRHDIGKTSHKKSPEPDSTAITAYASRRKEYSLNAIGGAIFGAQADITHPLCYGYHRRELAIFKTGVSVAEPLNSRYAHPVKFSERTYISGYVSEQNLNRLKNAPVISVQSFGRGKLISYHESMTFRGIWLATNKLFMNGVFFGKVIR